MLERSVVTKSAALTLSAFCANLPDMFARVTSRFCAIANRMERFAVIVAVALGSSQVVSGAPPAPVPGRGSESVRSPVTGAIRSTVNGLLGWQVGIFTSDFPALSFAESATLADALGLDSVGGDSSQRVSPQIDQPLDFNLSPRASPLLSKG